MVNSIKKFYVVILISFAFMNLSAEAFAAPQQFFAEGEYRLGDRDTREDAKKFALIDAKRKLAEQAGVYVESFTEVNNFQVSRDKINIVAQAVISIQSEQTEFSENGILCKAYVTGVIDTDSMENKLLKLTKDKKRREVTAQKGVKEFRNAFDTTQYDATKNLSIDLAEVEEAHSKMVKDLSKATAYTAGSEYKLQEVTGMTNFGFHNEKGEISNYLKEHSEMRRNYRFAELPAFVELVGAEKITGILNELNKKKISDAKDRMTWAKIERARAKSYGEIVLKEAEELFKRADVLMVDADADDRARLKTIRVEADDAIKLIRALEIRNKAVDEVAKKYERANKITAKNDKYNPKKKKNIFESLLDKIR